MLRVANPPELGWVEVDEEPLDTFDAAELEAEAMLAQYDDDPSPYDGTYSEM